MNCEIGQMKHFDTHRLVLLNTVNMNVVLMIQSEKLGLGTMELDKTDFVLLIKLLEDVLFWKQLHRCLHVSQTRISFGFQYVHLEVPWMNQ